MTSKRILVVFLLAFAMVSIANAQVGNDQSTTTPVVNVFPASGTTIPFRLGQTFTVLVEIDPTVAQAKLSWSAGAESQVPSLLVAGSVPSATAVQVPVDVMFGRDILSTGIQVLNVVVPQSNGSDVTLAQATYNFVAIIDPAKFAVANTKVACIGPSVVGGPDAGYYWYLTASGPLAGTEYHWLTLDTGAQLQLPPASFGTHSITANVSFDYTKTGTHVVIVESGGEYGICTTQVQPKN